MRVKVCGITNREDAVWALNDGAHFIGVDFRKRSPRRVLPADAKDWVPALPTFASVVGLFDDESSKVIARLAAEMNLKGIQLNGPQTPQRLRGLRQALTIAECPPFIIKALAVPGPEAIADIPRWGDAIDYVLLYDPAETKPGKPGRSPRPFDWSLAAAAAQHGKPVFLGGGLTPETVGEIALKARPFAVDVTSGIEKSTRHKNPAKMRAFIASALLGR
ncbi:MAG: phosphoribosylanthranilate isomerase [Elusimicrobia bacterium]|nr:phosphoribosylanthranilate isomerase [Elusimicrobiota bacterium]